METHEVIDQTETLLAHLLCAENDDDENLTGGKIYTRGTLAAEQFSAGSVLPFDPMRPSCSYTYDPQDDDRLYATTSRLLITSVPDIIGDESEIATMMDDRVRWIGLRRLIKAPRGIWIGGKAAAVYELHHRDIFPSGESYYSKTVAAISAGGQPLPCIIQGSKGRSGRNSEQLVLAASIKEDTERTGCFTTTVTDSASIVFPVPYGTQVELFKLRDAPLSPSGRRKTILHWVSAHLRNRGTAKESRVKEHLRGVHEVCVDGLRVRMVPNDQPV